MFNQSDTPNTNFHFYKPWTIAQNRPVRIAGLVDPPFASDCYMDYPDTKKCPLPGTEIQFIYTVIAGFLNLPIEWVQLETYEHFDRALDNGTADILGITYMMSQDEFNKNLLHTPVYIWDSIMLIVKKETVDKNSEGFILFRVFTPIVWFLMLVAAFVLWCINKIDITTDGFIVCDTDDRQRFPFINACCTLVLVILMGVYANILSIDLVQPKFRSLLPFHGPDEMADKLLDGTCRLVIDQVYQGDYEFDYWLVNPQHSLDKQFFSKMKAAFNKNPPLYVKGGREELATTVIKGSSDLCYIGLDYNTLKPWYESRYCNMDYQIIPKYLPSSAYAYYHRSPELGRLLDTVMTSEPFTLDNGYQSYLSKTYYTLPYRPECSVNVDKWQPLSLAKILDTFYILLSAAIAIFLIFLLEIIANKYIETVRARATVDPDALNNVEWVEYSPDNKYGMTNKMNQNDLYSDKPDVDQFYLVPTPIACEMPKFA